MKIAAWNAGATDLKGDVGFKVPIFDDDINITEASYVFGVIKGAYRLLSASNRV